MSPAPQTSTQPPQQTIGQLDRFQLLKILGEGTQGVVYLAFDPNLERQVAIKAIGTPGEQHSVDLSSTNDMQMLLREARTVSKFQHPNIVSIYEIGFIGAAPYLVLEYIAGPLLSHTVKAHRTGVPIDQAIALITQVVDGLAYAHDHGIIHGDLKPANVLVTPTKIAKITDFGIARRIGEQSSKGLAGSPRYMAPEYIAHRIMTPAADQFAAGIMLYQLLTGKHPVTGKSMELIFAQITAGEFPPPSSINTDLDPEIDAIVARTLLTDPEKRFSHISELKLALLNYQTRQLTNQTLDGAQPKVDSLRTLRQRIRDQKDFPALSHSITNLNNLFAGNQKSAPAIAAVISKDLALTSKVMRIANSAFVPHAGGEITTLSHAVMMLGFTTIREIASSLLMIDLIKGGSKSGSVKEQLVRSLFSATLTRKIAIRQGAQDVDTCYLVGMFYRLGKLLVCFHMPEEHGKISEVSCQEIDEDRAAISVLGYSYTEIGHEIAADWSMPDFLLDSIQSVNLQPGATDQANISAVYGSLSNDITDLLSTTMRPDALRPQMTSLRGTYQRLIDISGGEIEEILDGSRAEFQKYCTVLKIDTSDIALIKCFSEWDQYFPEQGPEEAERAEPTEYESPNQLPDQHSSDNNKTNRKSSITSLARGVQDVKSLIDSHDYDFDDLIRKILATAYYGVGCQRVLLCRCQTQRQAVKARYAVGKKVNNLLKHFQFPLDETSSVFNRAVQTGDDIIISDITADCYQESIPGWYRQLNLANSFALLPFQSEGLTRGFLYLDHGQPHYLDQLPAEQMAQLSTLRDLARQAYELRNAKAQQT